ncbi:MAG: type II toxin-antitoxin system prevent-host-death family antitoxin [Nitrospirae bacterium]|nr:type II toxin-antitoxin system prevent-host-death family antitoxin [Nitrospirota bacterium]
MLKTITEQNIGNIMSEVSISEDTYIIERAGKPLVAVMPIKEYERIQQDREKARREFFQWVDEVREYNKDVDPEILENEIAEAVEAVKKEELEEMKRKEDKSKELYVETC